MEVLSLGGNGSKDAAHKRTASVFQKSGAATFDSVLPLPKQGIPVHREKALPCQPV